MRKLFVVKVKRIRKGMNIGACTSTRCPKYPWTVMVQLRGRKLMRAGNHPLLCSNFVNCGNMKNQTDRKNYLTPTDFDVPEEEEEGEIAGLSAKRCTCQESDSVSGDLTPAVSVRPGCDSHAVPFHSPQCVPGCSSRNLIGGTKCDKEEGLNNTRSLTLQLQQSTVHFLTTPS